MTVLFATSLGSPERLVSDLDVATQVQWTYPDDGGQAAPTPGWYLMSSLQLTYDVNRYFQLANQLTGPYADMALFHVPPN